MAESAPLRPREGLIPRVIPVHCPIQASLGVLGRKWALTVLRDVAFFEDMRFSDMLQNNPGLTPRVLSFRLRQLQQEGFIKRVTGNGRREIIYNLTPKGSDAIPILTAFLSFGMKHHADAVFEDGKPRTLGQMLPGAQCKLLGTLAEYAAEGDGPAPAGRRPK